MLIKNRIFFVFLFTVMNVTNVAAQIRLHRYSKTTIPVNSPQGIFILFILILMTVFLLCSIIFWIHIKIFVKKHNNKINEMKDTILKKTDKIEKIDEIKSFITEDFQKLGINARIAVCLIYLEKILPNLQYFLQNNQKFHQYLEEKKQSQDFLDLAWKYVSQKDSNFNKLYKIAYNKLENYKKYAGYGMLDFLTKDIEEDEDNTFWIYRALVHYILGMFCIREETENDSDDLDDFSLFLENQTSYDWYTFCCEHENYVSLIEKKVFSKPDALSAILSAEEMQEIKNLQENLLSVSIFEPENIFGNPVGIEFREFAKGDI